MQFVCKYWLWHGNKQQMQVFCVLEKWPLLLLLLRLLLFVFYKMTYGNELLPRHLPFVFLRLFIFFPQHRLRALTLFHFLINTKICSDKINQFIRIIFKNATAKRMLIYTQNAQILRINRLIHAFSTEKSIVFFGWVWFHHKHFIIIAFVEWYICVSSNHGECITN